MYELVNVFELFLPQLLTYPNSQSPLNIDAANLFEYSTEEYERTVRMYVGKYAAGPKGAAAPPSQLSKEVEVAHKVSTDCEDHLDEDLSGLSQLSELSDTSDILFEEEIL